MRLTDISVRNLKPPASGSKVYYDDTLKGFGVRISQAGTKAFILATGKNRDRTTLGRYPHISLSDARRRAQELIGERASGKQRQRRVAFSEALTIFVAEKRQKNRARTIDENERILTKYCVSLHKRSLVDLTTHDITAITDKLSETPGTALHVFWSLRTFLRWCAKRRYLERNPIENLDAPHAIKFRDRVLSDDELRAVWKASDSCGQFGAIVKLLIVTGQRRSEVGGLRSEWVDLDQRTWTTPSNFTKNKRSHSFPVSSITTSLIGCCLTKVGEYGTDQQYLFPARGSNSLKPFNGWSKAKAQLDKKANINPWTLHDLRRTYATNLQRLGVKLEVIESLLNHVSGSRAGIVGVYNRHRYEAEMRETVNTYEEWFREQIVRE